MRKHVCQIQAQDLPPPPQLQCSVVRDALELSCRPKCTEQVFRWDDATLHVLSNVLPQGTAVLGRDQHTDLSRCTEASRSP